jgi:hypothetical protein
VIVGEPPVRPQTGPVTEGDMREAIATTAATIKAMDSSSKKERAANAARAALG